MHEFLFQEKPSNLHNSLIDVLVTCRCFGKLYLNRDILENQVNEGQRSFIEGVLVTNVDPEGVAYISGIRKGDIIYSLARIKIKNVNEFKDVLSDLDLERRTTIGVARNGNKRILSLNLSK